MRSKLIQKIMRFLMLGIGAGAGVALAFLCVQVYRMTTGNDAVSFGILAMLYVLLGGAGALLGELASPKVIAWCGEAASAAEKAISEMTLPQLTAMVVGVVTGLFIAALLTQILAFMGDSIFTVAASAFLYVVLGVIGGTVGKSRTEDFAAMLSHLPMRRGGRKASAGETSRPKVIDASALIDGRILNVHRTGFLEGELLLPDFVLEELESQAASADPARKLRGQRGLQVARRLEEDESIPTRVVTGESLPLQEAEVRLSALTREHQATLLTTDLNLAKSARQSGVRVMNLNDLAVALRTVTAAGDVLAVKIAKPGREAEQGVGYLEDGSMIVVEGGKGRVGETVEVTVTSVLQTSAGRMVFAKMNGAAGEENER